ncbi:hypothetical protein IQ13_1037 [Lacibacter cauensis]|uniref:Uncharacterized protein n=1 Tax=Lacibacter cauensis TaxID=510947 RepID=A0A562SY31_9BACT|nr:hypothetical protein [Lacibacter cauensis]TWI85868.1 hypothetical protein IQ13_1037 [Lacibacter cauensis]
MFKKIDIKYTLYFIGLIACVLLAIMYNKQLLKGVELFLSSEWTQIVAGILSFAAAILSKIKYKQLAFSRPMTFSQFKVPVEEVWSFISNPLTLVCSLSLAKGLFLQLRNIKKVFVDFSNLEITFIGIVVLYLLFDGITDFIGNVKLALSKTSPITAVPEPLRENE